MRLIALRSIYQLTVFYRFIAPEAKDDELKEYEKLLRKLYIQKELWNDEKGASNHITRSFTRSLPNL